MSWPVAELAVRIPRPDCRRSNSGLPLLPPKQCGEAQPIPSIRPQSTKSCHNAFIRVASRSPEANQPSAMQTIRRSPLPLHEYRREGPSRADQSEAYGQRRGNLSRWTTRTHAQWTQKRSRESERRRRKTTSQESNDHHDPGKVTPLRSSQREVDSANTSQVPLSGGFLSRPRYRPNRPFTPACSKVSISLSLPAAPSRHLGPYCISPLPKTSSRLVSMRLIHTSSFRTPPFA